MQDSPQGPPGGLSSPQLTLGHAFETPENVVVAYQPAGLGIRFLAWSIDAATRFALFMLLTILIFATGALADELRDIVNDFSETLMSPIPDPDDADGANQESVYLIVGGLVTLLWGLGSFVYYFAFEYLMRGQTIGKKLLGLRVVKLDGFSLDAPSIFVRNLFRIIDEMVLLWLVPICSRRNQRFGDMAAGTIVVLDEPASLSNLREHLMDRPLSEVSYRIDGTRLALLTDDDLTAMEMLLERWPKLTEAQQATLTHRIASNIAARLKVHTPAPYDQLIFVQDVLAQTYARMDRQLG